MAVNPSPLVDRDARCLWHPFTQHGADGTPIAVRGARGAWLELEDGRRILDGVSSWWTSLHGHGRPELTRALAEQANALDHVMFAGITHEPGVRLGERLIAHAPKGLTRCFYSDNGSTAVEVALKIAYQAQRQRGEQGRNLFVALDGGYHGDTFGALAVGDPVPFFASFSELLFEVRRVEPTAAAIDEVFAADGHRIAAMILEPRVQGAAGMRMHGNDVLVSARERTREHGAFLIADEVMTGFGRTGRLFACDHADVAPDLMALAKGLTGGLLPMAATLASEELYEAFLSADRAKAFFHGHSFTGHPIGCAVALASLDLVEAERTPERLDRIGARMANRLAAGLEGRGLVRDLRRTGGIVAMDLSADSSRIDLLSLMVPRLRRKAIELGALLRPLGDVLYLLPPSCITDEEQDRLVDIAIELAAFAESASR